MQRLQEIRSEIHFVVTATTRPKRPGEIDGVDYYFVSKPEFLDLIARNELIEHALVYGDYKGVPKKQVRPCHRYKSFPAVIGGSGHRYLTIRSPFKSVVSCRSIINL